MAEVHLESENFWIDEDEPNIIRISYKDATEQEFNMLIINKEHSKPLADLLIQAFNS